MTVQYTDAQIAALISERKPLPSGWRSRLRLLDKRGHQESQLDVTGEDGNEFRLILRRSKFNALDFSVILAVRVPQSSRIFRLRRCNGKSHEHTNHIEDETFYDYHIHMATERYQELGAKEDAYAQVTDSYADYQSALQRMITDANLVIPDGDRPTLFQGSA